MPRIYMIEPGTFLRIPAGTGGYNFSSELMGWIPFTELPTDHRYNICPYFCTIIGVEADFIFDNINLPGEHILVCYMLSSHIEACPLITYNIEFF